MKPYSNSDIYHRSLLSVNAIVYIHILILHMYRYYTSGGDKSMYFYVDEVFMGTNNGGPFNSTRTVAEALNGSNKQIISLLCPSNREFSLVE